MQPHQWVLANEKGSVIVLAMIVLALLTLAGISAITTSSTEMNIAVNDQLNKMMFYTADAGVEVGRQVLGSLKESDPSAWDRLLQGQTVAWRDSGGNPITVNNLNQAIDATSTRQVGLGTFTLQVSDNDDLDGNSLVDTDGTVVLAVTASGPHAQAQVQVTVCDDSGAKRYSQEFRESKSDYCSPTNSDGGPGGPNRRW